MGSRAVSKAVCKAPHMLVSEARASQLAVTLNSPDCSKMHRQASGSLGKQSPNAGSLHEAGVHGAARQGSPAA